MIFKSGKTLIYWAFNLLAIQCLAVFVLFCFSDTKGWLVYLFFKMTEMNLTDCKGHCVTTRTSPRRLPMKIWNLTTWWCQSHHKISQSRNLNWMKQRRWVHPLQYSVAVLNNSIKMFWKTSASRDVFLGRVHTWSSLVYPLVSLKRIVRY